MTDKPMTAERLAERRKWNEEMRAKRKINPQAFSLEANLEFERELLDALADRDAEIERLTAGYDDVMAQAENWHDRWATATQEVERLRDERYVMRRHLAMLGELDAFDRAQNKALGAGE